MDKGKVNDDHHRNKYVVMGSRTQSQREKCFRICEFIWQKGTGIIRLTTLKPSVAVNYYSCFSVDH